MDIASRGVIPFPHSKSFLRTRIARKKKKLFVYFVNYYSNIISEILTCFCSNNFFIHIQIINFSKFNFITPSNKIFHIQDTNNSPLFFFKTFFLKRDRKYIKYTVPKATLKRQIQIEKPGDLCLEKKINTIKEKITVTKNINSDKSSTTFNHVHDSYSSFKDNTSDKSSITVNHVPGSYSSFISDEIHKATINDWNPTNIQGKHYSYPPASVLATDVKSFGRVSKDHSFTREATFENIAIFLLKSPFLALADLLVLLQASVLLSILWKNLVKLRSVDFLPL